MSSDTVYLTACVNKLFYHYYVPYRGVVGGGVQVLQPPWATESKGQ